MSQQIIGLDMGAHSVKATVLRSRFRGFELAGFYQRPVVGDESMSEQDRIARTVEQLLAENRLKADGFVVSMPGLAVSVRMMTLPFTDRKKIARVIPFEMEGYIPFGLEDVVISHHIVGQEGGGTTVLAAALRKDLLREHLEALAKVGVVPRVVDIDFMALFSLCQDGLKEAAGCYAVVDIGDTKTSVCIMTNGTLGFGRSIPIAGRAITEAIEKEFEFSRDESERIKEMEGFLPLGAHTNLVGERKRIARTVESAVSPLVQEITRTFCSFEAQSQRRVERILVCGGTAQLSNLPEYLSEKMALPVDHLTLEPPGGTALGRHDSIIIPHAYGLGIRGVLDGRCSQINLLRDEFAYRTEIKGLRTKMIYIGVALGLIAAVFVFDGVNRYTAKKNEYAALKKEVSTVFRETFPRVKQVGAARQQMQSKLRELQKESLALIALGGSPVTALDMIREVTERAPPGVELDIDTFSFDAEKVRVSGRTDSFESVDRILKVLKGYELFEEVSLSNAKVDVKDNKVDFRLSMSLRSL
jgi:general secretion pathway protein L